MKVFVVNCGSSSIKYQLFDMTDESVVGKGIAEKIGLPMGIVSLKIEGTGEKVERELPLPNHEVALATILELLTVKNIIRDKAEIGIIGHRLVHAGEFYHSSVVVTEDVLEKMSECNDLAPLHNPHNITGVRTAQKLFPNAFQGGCFDTAYHQTMPDYAYMYPIDHSWYEKYKVRRYGFHGTSHGYVAQQAAEFLKKPLAKLRVITAHLGNGSSIAAIKNGESVDTSMGMTPLEGLMMGTRCGDIDPALVFFAARKGVSLDDFDKLLNKRSGMMGVGGISNDMRDNWKAIHEGNKRAELAMKMFTYRLKKYIGAYAAAMGGVEAIIFTGGIGENDWEVRQMACEGLEYMGVELDPDKNKGLRSKLADISKASSKVKMLVVPTNEELVIARESYRLYNETKKR
ncbi:MAG TPA: acetate kinase [bacterium]|nr:acetate kinase [bacterium]